MIYNGPIRESISVAQVAQVVAVAEHLVCNLWISHWRAVNVLIDCVAALYEPLWKVPNVMQHLSHYLNY